MALIVYNCFQIQNLLCFLFFNLNLEDSYFHKINIYISFGCSTKNG